MIFIPFHFPGLCPTRSSRVKSGSCRSLDNGWCIQEKRRFRVFKPRRATGHDGKKKVKEEKGVDADYWEEDRAWPKMIENRVLAGLSFSTNYLLVIRKIVQVSRISQGGCGIALLLLWSGGRFCEHCRRRDKPGRRHNRSWDSYVQMGLIGWAASVGNYQERWNYTDKPKLKRSREVRAPQSYVPFIFFLQFM